ncbi:retrovirus-related pol polyprotein from transposon TNT 1-94 [Tanacetum coccineum]
MDNHSVHPLHDFEQTPVMDFTDNEISSDSNIIPYSQYLQETQQATIQDTNFQAQQYSMILSVIEQIKSKKRNLYSNASVFKNESKEKENKYMENEIDLEKKIKELDNIICKVGQSAQTVHMLTKPQAFYDNTHKQALGYQNPFYLKKTQRIKPTLYDGVVLSNTHVAMPVIDDEETLILEEESRSKMSEKAKDPEVIAKKISHKPIDYENLNSLTDDFEKRFSPQQELSAEQSFWFHIPNPSIEFSYTPPVIVEVPSELPKVVQIVLWYLDSGCSKHITGNRSQLMNFVSKFLGTVRFGNDQIARIMGYGDYQLGNVIISRVYYVEGLGSRDTNLYTISLDDMLKSSPIYLLSKASKTKSWLWHRRLSHLNFGTLNKLAKDGLARGIPRLKFQKDHLCSACALGKSKKTPHQPKVEDTNQEKLYLLHMDLCGPMRVASINGKRYILVIVDDYSRFTWVRFLKTKDEAPAAIIKCIKNIQVRLKATVQNVRTDNGTEFVNQTLREWYENVGISHQTSVARTPQQNGVVERRNQTLVEAARTMLIFSKAPLFLWAEAINTACYTQNRSLIRL